MSVGKIPQTEAKLAPWAEELIEECSISIEDRRNEASNYRRAFYTGVVDEAYPSKHNKCNALVDTKASYLFSPSDVRFKLDFDNIDDPIWAQKADKAASRLSNAFASGHCAMAVSHAVETALIEKSCFIKLGCTMKPDKETKQPNFNKFKPSIVRQSFIGVQREDITELDDQDAFVHVYYLSPRQFERLIYNHPDREDLLRKAMGAAVNRRAGGELGDDAYFYELVLGGASGGAAPISTSTTPTGARGAIPNLLNPIPSPQLSGTVAVDLIRIDELWVWNDDQGDWTTIRYVAPGIILEGAKRHRNLSDIPGRHPFVKICPNETVGYFFGRSELANVISLQAVINKRTQDIDTIFHLMSNPPKAFIGFSGITPEKQMAMLSSCAHVFLDEPSGKVENIAPEMPAQYLEYLYWLDKCFEEAAGLNGILQGKGEPGVRSGTQTNQLLRTSTPRLRDQAFAVEGQLAALGDLGLKMMQAKDARVLSVQKETFMLSQLPDDARVVVDSHTSSPAFSNDYVNLGFALLKAGAIDDEDLIDMTHPPNMDEIKRKARTRKENQQKMLQELQQSNPQEYARLVQGGKR